MSLEFMNRSRLRTTTVATITSNTALAERPGNVLVPAGTGGLDRDSVVNVSQVLTIDRALHLDEQVAGKLPMPLLERVDAGLTLVLGLRAQSASMEAGTRTVQGLHAARVWDAAAERRRRQLARTIKREAP